MFDYDVIIVGAGVVGCAIARRLSAFNIRVCLLEAAADVACGATKANSAIVHGGYAEAHNKIKGRLCYQGRRQFAQLDSELHFGFDPIGSLVLSFDDAGKSELERLMANGEKNAVPDLEILDATALRKAEPNVSPEARWALKCEGAGVCSPYEFAIALAENAVSNGVDLFLQAPVTNIKSFSAEELSSIASPAEGSSTPISGFYVSVGGANAQLAGKTLTAQVLVNCAGLAAAELSRMVGITDFDIIPRTGEYLLFARGTGEAINHVLFQLPTRMGKGILVTPTYHGNLLVGPDAVNEDSPTTATTATDLPRLSAIFEAALKTTTALNPTTFIRSFAGIRPVSTTDDFVLGQSSVPGFIQCAGIQSPGLTSSPAIADFVLDLLQEHYFDLAPNPNYNPERAPIICRRPLLGGKDAALVPERVALPAGTPQRFVCRCEQVTEATIMDAISRSVPALTIDAVKRRTRAGMGFCQGSFCRPRVAEVMGRASKPPLDTASDVEHSGTNRVLRPDIVPTLIELKRAFEQTHTTTEKNEI